ncbi:exonuclease SbcC [Rhodanobacter sp. TND4EL1]
MNASDLLPKLRASFDSCVIDSEHNVVRCEHHVGEVVRSVYFFCPVSTLPSSSEFTQLQEGVVAPSYYRAQDASRWNHFLVFVMAGASVIDQDPGNRGWIEADKSYARKIVVQDDDLGVFLDRAETGTHPAVHANELQQIWTRELTSAGLAAIAAEDARASVIRAIRAGRTSPNDSPQRVPEVPARVEEPVTLTRLEIRRFGDRSLRGEFQLGRVNLIRGPNGVGKTSFIEAIEHFFCGTTLRNKGVAENLDASIAFSNGKTHRYKLQAASYYQGKDLSWYGRSTNRGNKLCEGFARYHFMNADAAVELSRDPVLQNIKEALAKIALGPDASYTWNRILEFERDISRELSPLSNQWNAIDERCRQDESRLQALRTLSPQVLVQLSALERKLGQLGWPQVQFPGPSMELKDFAIFEPLHALLKRAMLEPPTTVDAIGQAIARYVEDSELAKRLELSKHNVNAERARLRSEWSVLEEKSSRAARLRQYAERSYGELLQQRRNGDRKIAVLARFQMADSDIGLLAEVLRSRTAMERPLGQVANAAEASLNELRQSLQTHIQQKAREGASATARESLIGQMRVLARHYAEQHPQVDACPVCNTLMTATDLLRQLELSSASHEESVLEELTVAITTTEQQVADEQEYLRLLNQLMAVDAESQHWACEQALAVAWEHQNTRNAAQVEHVALTQELDALLREGFSQQDYDELLGACFPDQVGTEIASASIAARLGDAISDDTDHLRTIAVRVSELDVEGESYDREIVTLGGRYGAITDAAEIGRTAQIRIASYTAFYEALKALPATVIAAYSEDVPTLLALSRTITEDLDAIGERIRQERSRDAEIKTLETSIATNQRSGGQLQSEMENLRRAQDALVSLKTNHSLDQGLASFLSENQASIQHIFSRIHVPNELRLSALAECQLERVNTQGVADLSQISTGQRAALTLSIFLTLNLSLRAGPPIMLIDDPVAHIDDLNALAFLDYLADVAEGGRRQIFFATADDRLANLFEKKMGFLGAELAVINLAPGARVETGERLN